MTEKIYLETFEKCPGSVHISLLTVKFPRRFLLRKNLKHYSNEEKTLKLLKEIIVPYIQSERKTLRLDADYPALLTLDAFKEQMAPALLNIFKANNKFLTNLPANMTNLYQPVDLT